MKARVDLVFRNSTNNTSYTKAFFDKIINTGLLTLKIVRPTIELSVNIVGLSRSKELNFQYRNKNKATDVLSFPIIDSPISEIRKSSDIIAIGDLFICLPKAQSDAKKEGLTLTNKLHFLTVHGLLHLLGYDHELSVKKEKEMFALQKKILKKIK